MTHELPSLGELSMGVPNVTPCDDTVRIVTRTQELLPGYYVQAGELNSRLKYDLHWRGGCN